MKIGAIHWAFPPVIGGVESHLLAILPEIVKQGGEVFLLTSTVEGTADREDVEGVKVIRKKEMLLKNLSKWSEKGKNLYSIAENLFSEFIEENRIDVIKAHNLHLGWPVYSETLLKICKKKGIPSYLVLHNDFIEWTDPKYKKHENEMWRILLLDWDCLVSISEYIKRALCERSPDIRNKNWKVILHGIDLEKFSPASEPEKENLKKKYGFLGKTIIFHPARMGGGSDGKGVMSTIKILPEVVKSFSDAILVFSGGKSKTVGKIVKTPDISKEEKLIESIGMKGHVHIRPYTFQDIPNLYKIADVVVAPSQGEEPFGLCPVEAMASGIPAVVTNSGGLVESVVDGKTGFIIEKKETLKQLAGKIINLLEDRKLRIKMGKAGRKRVEEKFDKKRMAKDFLNLSKRLTP